MHRRLVAGFIAIALVLGLAVVLESGIVARHKSDAAQIEGVQTKHAPPAIAVVAAEVKTTDFPIMRYGTGFLSSPAVANIGSRIPSQITEIPITDGQTVKKGDVLFRLEDRGLKAALAKDQALLAKDQAALASAQIDLQRAHDILTKGAGTQQAYDQQLATTKGLEAAVQADQAAIEADQVLLDYATILAPISGRLGAISPSVGDLVEAGGGQSIGQGSLTAGGQSSNAQPLVTITQMDPLRVSFNLPEADLSLLQSAIANPGQATVSLSSRERNEPLAQGVLNFVDSSVDTASGTIEARASVDNGAGKLWPGQYVDVAVQFGVLKDAVTAPSVALQRGEKGSYVFVVGPDRKASMRPVTVEMSNNQETVIASGLSAGEKVVVEGQGRLKDGNLVTVDKGTEDKGVAKASDVGTEAGK